jgi:hypothetical protein
MALLFMIRTKMCRNKLIQVRCYVESIDKSITRDFTKPEGLAAWCPSCAKTTDTPEFIAFDKHVVKELFEENCTLIKEIMDIDVANKEEWLANMPTTKRELWNKIEELMAFNANLRNKMASKLISSENTSYWKDVIITAPFMNNSTKKRLKNRIRAMKDASAIRKYLSERYVINNMSAKNRVINITISLASVDHNHNEECNICFSDEVSATPLCKTCKVSNMCATCELDSIKRFGRCPFCNVAM